MASDQAQDPHSGILVASCGDAHVSNFGFYASPQRTLQFDLNDFDESAWAPWEWDLKRLVTSVIIGGRESNRSDSIIEQAALSAVASYVHAIKGSSARSPLERYYAHSDLENAGKNVAANSRHTLAKAIKDAKKRTGIRATKKLTKIGKNGSLQFIENQPLMTRVGTATENILTDVFELYQRSASVDIRFLLSQFTVIDTVRRVVGAGSVGTHCYLALLADATGSHLILQIKEANQSVLEEYGGIQQPPHLREGIERLGEGGRVVGLQRILQSFSDPFLGHLRTDGADFYVRQFHDMKGGIDMEMLADESFRDYAVACARTLARAHAKSPSANEVAAFIGKGKRIGESIVWWSAQYADKATSDYDIFLKRIRS